MNPLCYDPVMASITLTASAQGALTAHAVAPRHGWIAMGTDEGEVEIVADTDGRRCHAFGLVGAIKDLAFSADERFLFIVTLRGVIARLELANERLQFYQSSRLVHGLNCAISDDGRFGIVIGMVFENAGQDRLSAVIVTGGEQVIHEETLPLMQTPHRPRAGDTGFILVDDMQPLFARTFTGKSADPVSVAGALAKRLRLVQRVAEDQIQIVDLAGARIQTISLPENVEAHEMLVADELVHVFAKKLRFRSNGMEVAVTNRTYDVHSGDLRHVFEETFDASVSADAIRLDGPRNRLLLGLEKGGIAVMDLASKQHRWLTRSRPSEITLTHFDRGGDFSIVTWTKGAGVFVRSLLRADCRVLEGSQAFNAESAHINENSLVKSLDGRLLAGVDGVESVYIWNLATGALWCRIEAFTKDDWLLDDTPPIAFSDDGQFLVVFHQTDLATLAGHAECFRIERRTADALSVDRPVGTFDFGEPRPVGSIRIGKHAEIVWLRASASEPWLAFARSDVQGTPPADEDEPATRADGFSAELIGDDSVAVAFSPAGHRMALVRFDGTIEVWEAAASSAAWSFSCERIVHVLQESTPEMNRMAPRPVNLQVRDDGLVAVSVRSMVRYTFYEHGGAEIAEYVVLPDGEWIARGVAGWACSPRAFDFGPCSSQTRILTRAEVEQELGVPSERALEMSFRR